MRKIKPDLITESHEVKIKKGMTFKTYYSLITNITQLDFSAPSKWERHDSGYSRKIKQQAAKIIYKLKLPTRYKSKL